jgi:diaminopimelate decarboxylase
VAYFDNERDPEPEAFVAGVNRAVAAFRATHPDTRLILETGRYLVAQSGTYVTRVRYVKESVGERFAVTDGGTHHHMAAVGLGSFVKRNFPIHLLNRHDATQPEPWQITGPLCTPNDMLGRNVLFPPLRPGDLIGVSRSGAYGPTASPVQFLSHGYPAEVMVHNGRSHLIRERDEPEDLLRPQRLVPLPVHATTTPGRPSWP